MKKVVACLTLLLSFFLNGSEAKVKKLVNELEVPENTYLCIPNPNGESKDSVFIPTHCLTDQCKSEMKDDNEIPFLELSQETAILIIESLARLRLFPEKQKVLVKAFTEQLESRLSKMDTETQIVDLVKALIFLVFPERYIYAAKKAYEKLKKEGKLLREHSSENREGTDRKKIIFFLSQDNHSFPIWEHFLSSSVKQRDHSENSDRFDRQILEALIPLIIDYYLLKKDATSEQEISLKCLETIAKPLLKFIRKSPEKVKMLREALEFFELEELTKLINLLEPKFEEFCELSFSLDEAELFMKELQEDLGNFSPQSPVYCFSCNCARICSGNIRRAL